MVHAQKPGAIALRLIFFWVLSVVHAQKPRAIALRLILARVVANLIHHPHNVDGVFNLTLALGLDSCDQFLVLFEFALDQLVVLAVG